MARLNPANSTAVVDVPDGLAARYEAAGWTQVQPPKADPKRASAKKSEQ